MDLTLDCHGGGNATAPRPLPKRSVAAWLAGLVALVASLPEARAEVPGPLSRIVPLRALAAGAVAPEEMRSLCGRLPQPCRADDTRAYAGSKTADGVLWLIDAAKPSLIRWDRAGDKAVQWDFSGYAHSLAANDDGAEPSPLVLHPALYPGFGEGFSVALVREQREMYSGGGASFGVADFVAVEAGGRVGPVLYSAVPFSCQKMIRACFSERDYRTSKHCHDESSGYLTIATPVAGEWLFTWHETEWPADTRARDSAKSSSRFRLPRGAAGKDRSLPPEVSFCGGPT